MNDIIQQFISAMSDTGLGPYSIYDIIPDDKRRDYRLSHDNASKKKGFYKLKIDGDFGVGFFGDWRIGECVTWFSKAPKEYTKGQKAEFAKKLKAEKERTGLEQEQSWLAASREAQDFILFLDSAITHPYLDDKGLTPSQGLLIADNDLIIPMMDGETVWNYQSIKPNGVKLFLPHGKTHGTYHDILGTETIALVEGYATGKTVHDATGYTVRVCFNAGNLPVIATLTKAKEPQRPMIICADNDHETILQNGIPHNTGLIKGREAAKIADCAIFYPHFTENDTKCTDFDDLRKKYGIVAVENTILGKPSEAATGVSSPQIDDSQPRGGDFIPEVNDDWQFELAKDDKGNLIKTSTLNLLLLLSNHDYLKDVYKYDGFAKRIIVRNAPPWEDESSFKVRTVHDYDYVRLEAFMERQFKLKVARDKCADAIISTAQLPENSFNPAADYFNALQWDGVKRLDTWFKDYVSDGAQPDIYLKMVGRKFLCGLASRAMNPGVKFDTMIILEGAQYAGKSYLSKILGTINGEEYFLDDFKDIENKDSLMKMQGKLVVEFPEISAMRKHEVNDLKAFLSRTHDVFRPPYGRNAIEAGRQCVFVGTINPEGPYLRDVTGNRRYWPISCRDKIMLDKLRLIVPLLHAEAAHLVKHNLENLWMDDEEYMIAKEEQEKRVLTDVWTDRIIEIVGGRDEISTDYLMKELGILVDRQTPQVQSRISQAMVSIGYKPSRMSVAAKRMRGFIKTSKVQLKLVEQEPRAEDISW